MAIDTTQPDQGYLGGGPFVVQTIGFRTLYVFILISHERRELIQFNVTASPTAAWIWRQVIPPMSGGAVVCRPILGGLHHVFSRAA